MKDFNAYTLILLSLWCPTHVLCAADAHLPRPRKEEAWIKYEAAEKRIWDAYRSEEAGIWSDYRATAKQVWDTFRKEEAQIWANHKVKAQQAWAIYNANNSPETHEEAQRLAREAYAIATQQQQDVHRKAQAQQKQAYSIASRRQQKAYDKAQRAQKDAYASVQKKQQEAYEAGQTAAREAYQVKKRAANKLRVQQTAKAHQPEKQQVPVKDPLKPKNTTEEVAKQVAIKLLPKPYAYTYKLGNAVAELANSSPPLLANYWNNMFASTSNLGTDPIDPPYIRPDWAANNKARMIALAFALKELQRELEGNTRKLTAENFPKYQALIERAKNLNVD